jgi:hypothetical protein
VALASAAAAAAAAVVVVTVVVVVAAAAAAAAGGRGGGWRLAGRHRASATGDAHARERRRSLARSVGASSPWCRARSGDPQVRGRVRATSLVLVGGWRAAQAEALRGRRSAALSLPLLQRRKHGHDGWHGRARAQSRRRVLPPARQKQAAVQRLEGVTRVRAQAVAQLLRADFRYLHEAVEVPAAAPVSHASGQ